VLKVSRVVVLGHAQCGGVRAMMEGAAEATDFVEQWMAIAQPALRRARQAAPDEDILSQCETEVLRLSLSNLLTFPWIADEVTAGRLQVHGFHFGIQSGVLARLDDGRLVPVT
jgi:carbonic anhydrase